MPTDSGDGVTVAPAVKDGGACTSSACGAVARLPSGAMTVTSYRPGTRPAGTVVVRVLSSTRVTALASIVRSPMATAKRASTLGPLPSSMAARATA